jgi:hypothetical protein
MPRVYLPLLPLPVLAFVVAFSACSRPRTDEPATHVIPQAVALAPSPAPASPPPAAPAPSGDDAPSEEEVRAFEAPVAK